MRWFKQQGWQVDYVSDGKTDIPDADNQYAISIKRSPYRLANIRAYYQLKKILMNGYDIIHCHTPMGGVLGRLVVKNNKFKSKVIYTAHGLHFYKGAPLINWLTYYPVEKYLAKYTDCLITINHEDFIRAKKKFGTCKFIYKIDGVGVDIKKFSPPSEHEKMELRRMNGYDVHDFIILYIAEFTSNKNHKFLLDKVKQIKSKIKGSRIIFAGEGPLLNKYRSRVEKDGLSASVDFLGYRKDVDVLCKMADISLSPSRREGLPVGVVEGFASGLPVVCSKIRGHVDVITDERNGFLFELNKPQYMVDSILKLYNDPGLRSRIAQNNVHDAKKYSVDIAVSKMAKIYKKWI